MSRFNSLQEFDEPNGNMPPEPLNHTSSLDMSMGEVPPMPRALFIMRFYRLIPAITWVTAAIVVLVIWNLIAPFTAEIVTWIGSIASRLSLGVAILAVTGCVVALHRQVHEVLPHAIFSLHAKEF